MTWWTDADRPARRALVAASLGWLLDSFDINLYALVLPSLMAGLRIDQTTSGAIQSYMLVSAAAGARTTRAGAGRSSSASPSRSSSSRSTHRSTAPRTTTSSRRTCSSTS